ncbi:parvulin-like peptidyl-prolyl isomerase [Opitutaceae bacterium TAV1]|nr:peptidyl-prolyl cis-trans isomerase [Opitutaceae bacterium TAV5]EIP97182.1 parvulin-like peptidyl-prolyl isomerase [Opitutaceae bacterium TAV1]
MTGRRFLPAFALLALLSPAASPVLLAQAVATPPAPLGPSAAAPAATPAPASEDDGLNLRFANGIVAVVEDRVITVDDVRRELAPILQQIRMESANLKQFQDKVEVVQDQIIHSLIDRVLIVKDFYKDGRRHIPASYIDNALAENLTKQFDGDRARFLSFLRARGLTLRDYRKEVEEDIVYGYMRSQQRKSQSVVSPARVEEYYKQNEKRFYQEEGVHLRMIQLNREKDETDDQLIGRANDILAKLKAGESFEELAKAYTQDSRKARGGDWGWRSKNDLAAEFSEPLFALKKGEATAPILQGNSCFILYAEDRRAAGVPAIDEVRDQIERELVTEMARSSEEKWLQKLRRSAYIKLY